MKLNKIHFIIGIIIMAIASRLIPHPPNFTPITAVALFSIINFKNKYLALAIPIFCLFISDLIIGISLINLFVYFSFLIISESAPVNSSCHLSPSSVIKKIFRSFIFILF